MHAGQCTTKLEARVTLRYVQCPSQTYIHTNIEQSAVATTMRLAPLANKNYTIHILCIKPLHTTDPHRTLILIVDITLYPRGTPVISDCSLQIGPSSDITQ